MESETKLMLDIRDFPNLCRTCLTKGDLVPLKKDYLINLLKNITSIDLEKDDEDLPKSVCASCINKLEDIKSFIDLSKCNDSNLKEVLKNKPTFQCNKPIPDYESSQENVDDVKPEIEECDLKQESNHLSNIGPRLQKSTRRLYSCKRCQATFRTLKDIQKHHLDKNHCASRKSNECLNYGSDEENGKRDKTKMILYKCEICKKSFSTKSRLKNHLRAHTNDEPYECKTCGKKFKFPQNRRRHENIVHRGIKPYKCDICGKEFARLERILRHRSLHSNSKPCTQCGILLKRGAEYKMHMVQHKLKNENNQNDDSIKIGDDATQFLCRFCGETFTRRAIYHQHLIEHRLKNGDIQDFETKCNVCGKMFSSKYALQSHMAIHEGKKEFLCPACGKAFMRKCYLELHSKIHSEEKPYECKECGKRFRAASTYNTHTLVHTGQRPYKCEVCSKSFKQSTHLRRHQVTHTGEKPYKCTFCGKNFAQNCNLKTHMRIHTGETPFHCSVCDRGFYDTSSLKKHAQAHVKNDHEQTR